jgi:hypothetical protein
MFGKTEDIARRQYDIMVRGDLYASELSVLEQANAEDPRVLGSDEFIESLKKPKWKPRSRLALDELIEQMSKQQRVSVEAVVSTSKLPELSCARAKIARRAIDERIASLRQVARTLNRCPTGLGRLARRHRE